MSKQLAELRDEVGSQATTSDSLREFILKVAKLKAELRRLESGFLLSFVAHEHGCQAGCSAS